MSEILTPKQQKKLEKMALAEDSGVIGIASQIDDIDDKLDEISARFDEPLEVTVDLNIV